MSNSAAADLKRQEVDHRSNQRRAWRAALAALVCGGLSSLALAQAEFGAVQGKLALTAPADFAGLDGNRLHDWQRHYRQGEHVSTDFGTGWGSRYQTRLVRMPGGTVVIAGGDSGPVEYPAQDEKSRDAEAHRLARETEKEHRVLDANELRRDLALRTRLVLKLGLAAPTTASGTRWRDPICDGAGVLQREHGFVHTPCKGPVEYFDREGRLMELRFERSGAAKNAPRNILRIDRNAAGELVSVADGAEDRIDFVRQEGRIVAARARHDATEMEMRYAYDRGGRLESVTRVYGPDKQRIVQTYAYDADDRLVQAGKARFNYDAAGRVAAIESDIARQTFGYKLADDGTLATRLEWQPRAGGQPPVIQESETDKYGRPIVAYDRGGTRMLFAPRTGRVLMKTDTRGVESRFTYGAGSHLSMIHTSNGDRLLLKYGGDGLPSELKLSSGAPGKNGELTDYGELLAPATSGVIKLTWHAKDKPARIAWMGKCRMQFSYGADGEATAEPSIEGSPECMKQLGNIYSSFFQ